MGVDITGVLFAVGPFWRVAPFEEMVADLADAAGAGSALAAHVLQSIEVTDQNIGSFNRIARKYGIDFAPFKVKGEKRYMVFFKAPDADAMTAAFKEYTAKQVRKAERPSVLEKLQHFKSLIQAAVVDRTKRKELER